MKDIDIRITGSAGRITLARPQALNAMTYDMCLAIEAAMDSWRDNDAVTCVILDAEGDRAFCSGGDIADLYAEGRKGNFDYGRRFWSDEYRLNHKIFTYAKPVISFMQGFTMGGGVGLGCHGSHRVVGESSQIAMPECGIGLVPDVGGSMILAQAPAGLGEYLGISGARMNAADAIYAGFADYYIPQLMWINLIEKLEGGASPEILSASAGTPPDGSLAPQADSISALFSDSTLSQILTRLTEATGEFEANALKTIRRNSPLSMACTIDILHRLRSEGPRLEKALDLEYRFTSRASEHGDFLEGIRAAIIDKDRKPQWQYPDRDVPAEAIARMLQPTGTDALNLSETPT